MPELDINEILDFEPMSFCNGMRLCAGFGREWVYFALEEM